MEGGRAFASNYSRFHPSKHTYTGSIVLAGARPEESPPIQVDWKVRSIPLLLFSLCSLLFSSNPPVSHLP